MLSPLLLFKVFFAAALIIGLQIFSSEPDVLKDLEHLKEESTTVKYCSNSNNSTPGIGTDLAIVSR